MPAVMSLLEVKEKTPDVHFGGSREADTNQFQVQDNSKADFGNVELSEETFDYYTLDPNTLSPRDRELYDVGQLTGMILQLGFNEVELAQSAEKLLEAERRRDLAMISYSRLLNEWTSKGARR